MLFLTYIWSKFVSYEYLYIYNQIGMHAFVMAELLLLIELSPMAPPIRKIMPTV